MATAEEIKAFREQENRASEILSAGEYEDIQIPEWMKKKVDYAGLGNLEWLADFREGKGPNILVEDQLTFTDTEKFAQVLSPSADASVEEKIAFYLDTESPSGQYSGGFRYGDAGEGNRWTARFKDLNLEGNVFGGGERFGDKGYRLATEFENPTGVPDVIYDDDPEDASRGISSMADRAIEDKWIQSGVSYMHPAQLSESADIQETTWQHEALHGVFNELRNSFRLDPWFAKLLESESIPSQSGRNYGFEEMVNQLVDAKRNGSSSGLHSILDIPQNVIDAYHDHQDGRIDEEELREVLKTTISYFTMEAMLSLASSHNEYMSEGYLRQIELLSAKFSKTLEDMSIPELYKAVVVNLDEQKIIEWMPDSPEMRKNLTFPLGRWLTAVDEVKDIADPSKNIKRLSFTEEDLNRDDLSFRPRETRPAFIKYKNKKIAELFEDPTGEVANEFYAPRGGLINQ